MPGTSKAKNPKGVEITFDEATHIYKSILNEKEIYYTSGTTFVGKFFKPFDPDGTIAAKCAAKRGITVESLKAEWDAKRDASCHYGTRVHETCEDVFLGRKDFRNQPENVQEQKVFPIAKAVAAKIKSTVDILGIEKIVFDPDLQLAGTIDFFGQSRKDKSFLILDHKTNSKIERDNVYKKFAKDPISHVPDTSFGHYTLQLNLYQYLLKYGGYVPKDAHFKMYLNHITADGAHFIEVPDAQTEIRDMVIDYLLKRKLS